jgi:hypothetical protein
MRPNLNLGGKKVLPVEAIDAMKFPVSALLAAALMIGSAAAQEQVQEEQAPESRTFSGVYAMRMWGITAGELRYAATVTPDGYSAESSQRAKGIVRALVKNRQDYHSTVTGVLVDGAPRPVKYRHEGGKRHRIVNVTYGRDKVAVAVNPAFPSQGDPPATQAQELEAVDSLTAYLTLIMAPGANGPCPRTLKVFDGRGRFDLEFSTAGADTVRTIAWKGKTIRCTIVYKRISGFDPPEPGERRVFERPLTIWFAPLDNGLYAPVKIAAPTNYGEAVIVAESFSSSPPPLQASAAR